MFKTLKSRSLNFSDLKKPVKGSRSWLKCHMGHSTSNQPMVPGTPSQNLIKFGQCVHQHILGSCAKIFPHNVVWYLRYDHFYTGEVAAARERQNSEAFLIANNSGSMLDTAIKFSPHY